MTKDQKYKKEYAAVLFRIAEGDFSTLRVIFAAADGRKENVCFIAQQVVEKCLKAILVHHQIAVPFSHSIELLLSKFPAGITVPHGSSLDALTQYATNRRHEEGFADLDADDLKSAFDAAASVIEFTRKAIQD